MFGEMCALQSSDNQLLVDKSIFGFWWLYNIKIEIGPDGKIDDYKTRMVANKYT